MMTSAEDWATIAKQKIDNSSAELNKLSQAIWNKPELKFNEHFAHKVCLSIHVHSAKVRGHI